MMDHPHIAKVLDAGATDAGRPYFVMELVRGIPIATIDGKKVWQMRQVAAGGEAHCRLVAERPWGV